MKNSKKENQDCLIPIIGSGIGRVGSTLFMEILGTSPQIAFDRIPPFERRYLTYFLQLALLMNKEFKADDEWNMTKLIRHTDQKIGPLPFKNPELIKTVKGMEPFWIRCFLSIWREFSLNVTGNSTGKRTNPKKTVIYYAEKVPNWVFPMLQEILNAKVYYLVRDPRDIWLSILASDKKRGFYGFGRKEKESKSKYLERFVFDKDGIKDYIKDVCQMSGSEDVLIIRYEDMIQNIKLESKRLENWLGVTLNVRKALKLSDNYKPHRTSKSFKHSVYRWKKEMDQNTLSFFKKHLGKEIEKLGYMV